MTLAFLTAALVAVGAVVVVSSRGSDAPAGTVLGSARFYPKLHLRLVPPVPAIEPRTTAAHAWEVWTDAGIHPEAASASRSRTLELARFTDNGRSRINSDRSTAPIFQDRLAWVITFRGVPETPIGQAGRPAGGLTRRCDFLFVVDAQTGRYLTAYDLCPGG